MYPLVYFTKWVQEELCPKGTRHFFDIWHIGKSMYLAEHSFVWVVYDHIFFVGVRSGMKGETMYRGGVDPNAVTHGTGGSIGETTGEL